MTFQGSFIGGGTFSDASEIACLEAVERLSDCVVGNNLATLGVTPNVGDDIDTFRCATGLPIGEIVPPGPSVRQYGKLTASLLAIQVTNATGVSTSPDEVVWRIMQALPRKETGRERDPNVGPIVTYTPISCTDAFEMLSGVFVDKSGLPVATIAHVASSFLNTGFMNGIQQIGAG